MAAKKNDGDSFVFYKSFFDMVSYIPDAKVREEAYAAICEYAFNENEIETDNTMVNMVIAAIKPQIDANRKRRENGNQGGREPDKEKATGSKTKEPMVIDSETDGCVNKEPNVNVNVNVNANVNDNENNIVDSPIDDSVSAEPEKTEVEQEFEELWQLYPNKQGKQNALKAYRKARKGHPEIYAAVLGGIRAYLDFIRKKNLEQQYIKHGSTWFTQQCWNDDYTIENTAKPKEEKTHDEIIRDAQGKWGAIGDWY